MTARVLDLAGRIALVLCLFALSVYFVVRPFLGDDYENMQRAKAINQVVERGGPVKVDGIEWKVNSMKAYTRLLNEDREAIDLDVPAGAIVVVVEATVTADKTVVVDGEGYSCNAELADDRGNRWEEERVRLHDADLLHEFGQPGQAGGAVQGGEDLPRTEVSRSAPARHHRAAGDPDRAADPDQALAGSASCSVASAASRAS